MVCKHFKEMTPEERLHSMKALEEHIINVAVEFLEEHEEEVDQALIEITAKYLVWSFILENAVEGTREDFKAVIDKAIENLYLKDDNQCYQVNIVLDVCEEIIDHFISKREHLDSCRELDSDF